MNNKGKGKEAIVEKEADKQQNFEEFVGFLE